MKVQNNPVNLITMATPFPVGPVNVYLIKEDPITLIDAGPNLPNSEEYLEAYLDSMGVQFKDIKRLIITHAHPDHIGLASRIQELSGAEVFLHEQEIEKLILQNPAASERAGLLRQAGIPGDVVEQLAQWNKENRSRFMTKLDMNTVIPLKGRETFGFESGKLEVIFTPGHSPGHICLYDPERKFLFSGDHILANISPNPLLELAPGGQGRSKSLLQYLDSLRKVTQKPLEMVYPGHGSPFSDYPEALDRFYHYFRQREEAVFQLVGQQGKTAYEVAYELYPDMQGVDIFLGVSKAMGHLDLLVDEGRVRETEVDGILYFSN